MSKYAIFGTDAKGVETIKGNGWDINSERIELNAINAECICEDDFRCISMNGPAVEDIFRCLRELIKENEALSEKNERLTEENYMLRNYCDEQGRTYKTEMDKRYVSDANISHILPTLNAEINRLKEENKHLRKKADKTEKDFEALKKHTVILENRVDEYDRRFREATAIIPKPSPGYCIGFDHINVSSTYKNSDGTYNICLWGNSVNSLREKITILEKNNKAYNELCISLQQTIDRKEVPNDCAYTEHDAD